MISTRPYLIRAFYDWILDNDLTPYIAVDANVEDVQVPMDYVENGSIVLDISPEACRGLHIENDRVIFSASFSGKSTQIYVPPHAVVAIYAKENCQGMIFTEEEDLLLGEDDVDDSDEGSFGESELTLTQANEPSKKESNKKNASKPHLKIIK